MKIESRPQSRENVNPCEMKAQRGSPQGERIGKGEKSGEGTNKNKSCMKCYGSFAILQTKLIFFKEKTGFFSIKYFVGP